MLAEASVRPGVVVDDLGVDVLVAAEHGQPRPLGRALERLADAKPPPAALPDDGSFVFHGGLASWLRQSGQAVRALAPRSRLLGHRLALLAADLLALVANALALVGFRLAQGPDLGGELADLLLVDSLDRRRASGRDRSRQTLRDRHLQFVGKPDAQLQALSFWTAAR